MIRVWREKFEDPARIIGDELIQNIPNMVGLFWVDFTLETILQPKETAQLK